MNLKHFFYSACSDIVYDIRRCYHHSEFQASLLYGYGLL